MFEKSSPFPPLPIDAVLPELKSELDVASSAVLVAEPGAGKTTRVPLALLDAHWRGDQKILLLVPRRIAARAAAAQMSRLLHESVGQTVGYRVRSESKFSKKTRIEVITAGVFTRMIVDDPELRGIGAVIFDEFHERSLEADLGLALTLDVQNALRPDLRMLVMSATIDAARVCKLMGQARTISVQGRLFPVETRYLPPVAGEKIEEAVSKIVLRALYEEQGSILVFLPGTREIERVANALQEQVDKQTIIAPLYGALNLASQDKAVSPAPQGMRKVVLASAIAETSLTIEDVSVVIDSGLARIPRFDPDSGLTRLETVKVSQASAEQRRGRAGRLKAGVCYRLWAEGQSRALIPFNRPEILEADLSSLLLDCAAFGVSKPEELKFMDAPPSAALAEARMLLQKLGALDRDGKITSEGRRLAKLPLPPRLAHMLLNAAEDGGALQAAEIAALLTERGLGGHMADLSERLHAFRADKSPRAQQARSMAQGWLKLIDGKMPQEQNNLDTGEILSLAYPDRIALRRAGKRGEYLMANGKGAYLDASEQLARFSCLVIAEAQGAAQHARILLAAPFDEKKIEAHFADHIESRDEFSFDAQEKRVRGRRVTQFGSLLLKEQPLNVAGINALKILLDAIKTLGLETLNWPESARQFLARINFLHRLAPESWPQLTLEGLNERVEEWLAPYIFNFTALSEITPQILDMALEGLLLGEQKRALDKQAPVFFISPLGQNFRIDYEREAGPVVALRVQQIFGLKTHPMLAGGKVALAFELLSPALRPIQLTCDIPAFWAGSWAEVRRQMRGQYPRHDWPEEPASALPTARAKPRKRK
jgi:ATP-dependent helicase HrpB